MNGNRPRQNYDGKAKCQMYALKKIRNRLQDMGFNFHNRKIEQMMVSNLSGSCGLIETLKKALVDKKSKITSDEFASVACSEWTDVRSFGQVFAFKGSNQLA